MDGEEPKTTNKGGLLDHMAYVEEPASSSFNAGTGRNKHAAVVRRHHKFY